MLKYMHILQHTHPSPVPAPRPPPLQKKSKTGTKTKHLTAVCSVVLRSQASLLHAYKRVFSRTTSFLDVILSSISSRPRFDHRFLNKKKEKEKERKKKQSE